MSTKRPQLGRLFKLVIIFQPQQDKEEEQGFELGGPFVPSTTFRALPAVPTTTEAELPTITTTASTVSPNVRASLLFLTNPNLSEEDIEDDEELFVTSPQPAIPRRLVTTTLRPLPAIASTAQPAQPSRSSLETIFNSIQQPESVTERLRPEEELFNNVQNTVVTRPRQDPFLNRQRLPTPPRRPERPETPRRLESPIKSLPPRPTLPRDPVRLANRARQPSAVPVSPAPPAFVTSPAPAPVVPQTTSTQSFPVAQSQPVQPVSRPRIPVRTTPKPFTKVSADGDYIYEYVYEYENDYGDESPALVDNIDDYDLNPLTSKVRTKKHMTQLLFSLVVVV